MNINILNKIALIAIYKNTVYTVLSYCMIFLYSTHFSHLIPISFCLRQKNLTSGSPSAIVLTSHNKLWGNALEAG